MNYNKAISPVVAVSLLIVVSVVAVVGYQSWYQGYQSILTSDVETRSTSSGSVNIEYISSEGILYIKNSGTENISMSNIEVGGIDCETNESLEPGVNKVDITSCLSDSGTNNVMIVTDAGIVEKNLFVEDVSIPPIPPVYFTSVWNTSKTCASCSASDTIILPLYGSGTYNFTVHWGDGNSENVIGIGGLPISHTYTTEGEYEINISGEVVGFRFDNGGDKSKLIEIKNWGPLRVGNNDAYFYGCDNLDISATDALNLTGTTNFAQFFRNTVSLTNPNFNNWDVSKVTTMNSMFLGATNFNGEIDNWDVGKVTNMGSMFQSTSLFNKNLNTWNTGNVTNMGWTFAYATNFNGEIGNWDVGKVTTMREMFRQTSFNQSINNWNTSKVEDMQRMFYQITEFNQDLDKWDLSKVTTMSYMFSGATSFNGNVSTWNTSNINYMNYMFSNCYVFNQDLNSWNTSNVLDMSGMFYSAYIFNGSINNWDIGNVTNTYRMFFNNNDFDQDISGWNVSSVLNMGQMLYSCDVFNKDLSSWDVNQVTNCGGIYDFATAWTLPKPDFAGQGSTCTP